MSSDKPEPKKRGRKAKTTTEKSSTPKKRGRKPKGGKIVENTKITVATDEVKPNVILHLKCNSTDIIANDITDSNVKSFTFESKCNDLNFQIIENNNISAKSTIHDDDSSCDSENVSKKHLFNKLKELQHNLHTNNISDKKSACFWCTFEFDNPPIYIPKNEINGNYNVYGCFCSPECATAHLMTENIDTSSKFERYYILNHIYAKIYEYKKNIKPAPNPYYTLDKFYGNLSITEYRKLLNNDRLLFVVDKPMTRILPELHDDNDDYMISKKPSNMFKVRKTKKTSKNNIVNQNFGITVQ